MDRMRFAMPTFLRRRPRALAVVLLGLAAVLVLLLQTREADEAARDAALEAQFLDAVAETAAEGGFARLSGSWALTLPEDHGAHPEAQSESWLLSIHLRDEAGAAVVLQFALTRYGLSASEPDPENPWQPRAIWRAHTLFADADGAFATEERFSRVAGAAGHDASSREVWLDDWVLRHGTGADGAGLSLAASAGDVELALDLAPSRTALQIDPDGQTPLRGFAFPRLAAEAELRMGDEIRALTGTAWLDRLWGDLPPPGGPLANDRLVAQLDDGTDLSVLRTRRRDGRGSATVDALLIGPDGARQVLSEAALSVAPMDLPDDAAAHEGWRISGAGLDLRVTPLSPGQEPGFVLPGWTGAVRIEGTRDGRTVNGLGTMQLSEYDAP